MLLNQLSVTTYELELAFSERAAFSVSLVVGSVEGVSGDVSDSTVDELLELEGAGSTEELEEELLSTVVEDSVLDSTVVDEVVLVSGSTVELGTGTLEIFGAL